MDAIVFSWSGSFKDDFDERKDEITHLIDFVHDQFDMEVGLLSSETREDTDSSVNQIGLDFAVGQVEDILEVMHAFAGKYGKVFFITDIEAEIVSVNQSGAYTVGVNSTAVDADSLGGAGANYIVDSLEEFEHILLMEEMDG